MFEILRDVDNCPVGQSNDPFVSSREQKLSFSLFRFDGLLLFSQAYVLSSHRVYVSKADTFELSDTICGKGQAVTIFLFNDSLEVCNSDIYSNCFQYIMCTTICGIDTICGVM